MVGLSTNEGASSKIIWEAKVEGAILEEVVRVFFGGFPVGYLKKKLCQTLKAILAFFL